MKKVLIWLMALGTGFVVLLIAAVLILPKFINVETYLPEIEKKVSEATGRSFSLGKDFDVSVFPWAGVSFNELKLGNPEEYGGGEFVKVKSFEVRLKLLPLLSKQIEINKFVLDGPEILLVKNADGKGNWSMGGDPAKADTGGEQEGGKDKTDQAKSSELPLTSLDIKEFSVTNGRLTYIDKGVNQTKNIDGITLQLNDVSLERPIAMMFGANLDSQPISIEGTLGPIGKTPGQGTVNIDLAIKAFKLLAVNLKGDLVDPATKQQFNLNVKVEPFSPRQLLKTLKIPLPIETKDPGVLNKVALNLNAAGDPTAVTIKDSSIALDDSNLKMSAAVKDMTKPDVAFKLDLDGINIDRYLPPPKEKVEAKGDTNTTSSDGKPSQTASEAEAQPINYEPLRRLIVDGEVNIGEIIASGAKVQNVVLKIAGKNGIFDLNPLKLDLYQGGLNVVGKLNVQKDSPVTNVDVKAKNIQAGPLLKDSVKKDILEGTMNVVTAISIKGDNAAEIKQSLNGKGDIEFLDGALVGIDIAEMGRTLSAGLGYEAPKEKPRTDFAELKVPFTLTNGVFQTNGTSLQSPLLRVTATGTAGLVSEKLDLKIRPKVVGTLKGQGDKENRSGLSIPILVEGTFSEPEYSADLSAIASEEEIIEAIKDPESAKKKVKELKETGKDLEKTGKSLLKSFGFGK